MTTAPLVSLIVATVGRSIEVTRLLDSLVVQTVSGFEVLIIDQNQDDRLKGIVQNYAARGLTVKHLRMPAPNLSLARNAGLSAAHGEYIAFPDDDCWYAPEAIGHVIQAFERSPQARGVVACWLEQALANGQRPERKPLSLVAWRKFRDGDASSISLFFRRGLFEQLGGFDQRFGVGQWFGAGEETDFVLRVLTAGALIEREPAALVHHHYDKSPAQDWRRAWHLARRRGRGTGGLYAKHKLDTYVILRGCVAPFLRTVMVKPTLPGLTAAIGTCVGRIEGYFKFRSQRDSAAPAKVSKL